MMFYEELRIKQILPYISFCLLRILYNRKFILMATSFRLILIVLGFNDTSTLVGHFVLSPREREKRDSKGDEREG